MRSIKSIFFCLVIMSFIACSEDEAIPSQLGDEVLIEDMHAPNDVIDRQTGEVTEERPFVYFNFQLGEVVSESETWDLAFKGTTIISNGGVSGTADVAVAMLENTEFESLNNIPSEATFRADTEERLAIASGSGNGWYNYNSQTNLISPIPGRIFIVRTTSGDLVKVEFLSYYQGNPPLNEVNPFATPSAYYTFRYVSGL